MTDDQTSTPGTGDETGSGDRPTTSSPQPRKASGAALLLGIVALVLAIGALGITAYLWYQVKVEQRLSRGAVVSAIKSSVNEAQVRIAALEDKLETGLGNQAELRERIDTQIPARLDKLGAAQQDQAGRIDNLAKSIEKVYTELDRSLASWALEEVEQLLRMANHALQLSGDVTTTITALELADKRLEELGNPAFLPVRERLAASITQLKSLNTVDIAGLSLTLSNLAAKVDQLPLAQKTKRPITPPTDTTTGKQESSEGHGWLAAGTALLSDLEQLVRIQNTEKPPKPLLTPEQRYFLYQNLRLMLSGAQIAALRRNTPTFQHNLKRAGRWIREYFNTGHRGVQQFLTEIDAMRKLDLSPELPDISGSLTALERAKQGIHSQ